MSYSEKKTDIFGREYTQYYDDDHNKVGTSEEKEDVFGRQYTQYYDKDYNKTGTSEEKKDIFGSAYTQNYDDDYNNTGTSEEKKDILGKRYTQYCDHDYNRIGTSEDKEDILGREYTTYYDDAGATAKRPHRLPRKVVDEPVRQENVRTYSDTDTPADGGSSDLAYFNPAYSGATSPNLGRATGLNTRTLISAISGAVIGAPIGGIAGFIFCLIMGFAYSIVRLFFEADALFDSIANGVVILGVVLGIVLGTSSGIRLCRSNSLAAAICAISATALLSLAVYQVDLHIDDARAAVSRVAAIFGQKRTASHVDTPNQLGKNVKQDPSGSQRQENDLDAATKHASISVLDVQSALTTLGYDTGPVDGIGGSTTTSAVAQYATDHKIAGPLANALPAIIQEARRMSANGPGNLAELHKSYLPPRDRDDGSLSGFWSGNGKQVDGSTWPVTIEIDEALHKYVVNYPSLKCGGYFEPMRSDTDSYKKFKEHIEFGRGRCVENGTAYLTLRGNNMLFFWYYPNGREGAKGDLTRKE